MNLHRQLLFTFLLSAFVFAGASSCSVVVGNVKPVDQKSDEYGVMDLSKTNADWVKLDQEKAAEDADPSAPELSTTEVADVAYQSKSTASIISLNSACRKANELAGHDLRTLTNLLFLGMTDVTLREERGLEIRNNPALETTIQGKLHGGPMKLRTVVLRRDSCVYDMVYMARPQFFDRQQETFSHFIASLRLR